MYQNGNGIDAYRQTDVITADPKRLVLLCYEGAISSLKKAKEFFLSKEYEAKGKEIQRALDAICLLAQGLDLKNGGEVAANLASLYIYMSQCLIDADIEKDTGAIDEVVRMLEELESAWKEIGAKPRIIRKINSDGTIVESHATI